MSKERDSAVVAVVSGLTKRQAAKLTGGIRKVKRAIRPIWTWHNRHRAKRKRWRTSQ